MDIFYAHKVMNYNEVQIVIESNLKQVQSEFQNSIVQVKRFPIAFGTTKRIATLVLAVRGDEFHHQQRNYKQVTKPMLIFFGGYKTQIFGEKKQAYDKRVHVEFS